MNRERIYILISKYRDNTASEAEKEELLKWYREKSYQDAEFPESEDAVGDFMLSRLNREIKSTSGRMAYIKWAAAASVLLILSVSWLFISKFSGGSNKSGVILVQKNDIPPGRNKAILTLADGSKILLTDAGNGKIASQNGIQITKSADGQLIYTIKAAGSSDVAQPTAFNTIETPKGGQYQVVLPDGSKVWLNAFSSLKFPVNFNSEKERRVELTGEAYFEVAKNKAKPFIVLANVTKVQVFGTHFNINAYTDNNNVTTTLLEGSVRMDNGSSEVMLLPGQQGAALKSGAAIKVSLADIQQTMAWKNGFFIFHDLNIVEVMKQVSRWYDVDIEYQNEDVKNNEFGGTISRYKSITELLDIMQLTRSVHFKIEGRRVIIMK
ncbi:MAG: hypothetical protein JWR54_3298 [Mucilaginibacter sp.]|nr:hypothetical protein [Mucilaginibacter sp.]